MALKEVQLSLQFLGPFQPFGKTVLQERTKDSSSNIKKIQLTHFQYSLFSKSSSTFDEELFFSKNKLFWSTSGNHLERSFSLSSSIQQALWCSFGSKKGELEERTKSSLVVLYGDGFKLKIYNTETGEDFAISLPFKVQKLWSFPSGLLLQLPVPSLEQEKETEKESNSTFTDQSFLDTSSIHFSTLYYLLHPLDEPKPISCTLELNSMLSSTTPSSFRIKNQILSRNEIVYSPSQSIFPFVLTYISTNQMLNFWTSEIIESIPLTQQLNLTRTHSLLLSSFPTQIFIYQNESLSNFLAIFCSTEQKIYLYLLETKTNFEISLFTTLDATGIQPIQVEHPLLRKKLHSFIFLDFNNNLLLHLGSTRICKLILTNQKNQEKIKTIKDSVDNRFNIEFINGNVVRASISLSLSSILAGDCLRILFLSKSEHLSNLASSLLYKLLEEKSSEKEWNRLKQEILVEFEEPISDNDWNYLLQSQYHQTQKLKLKQLKALIISKEQNTFAFEHQNQSSEKSISHEHLSCILIAFHLLYENYKLNMVHWKYLSSLVIINFQIALKMEWISYLDHYTRDFGEIFLTSQIANLKDKFQSFTQLKESNYPDVPNIYQWLLSQILKINCSPFPSINSELSPCSWTRKICRIFQVINTGKDDSYKLPHAKSWNSKILPDSNELLKEKIIWIMSEENIQVQDLYNLPFGIAVPLFEILHQSRQNPINFLPLSSYLLMQREDIAKQMIEIQEIDSNLQVKSLTSSYSNINQNQNSLEPIQENVKNEFGLEHETSFMRFNRDLRLKEIMRVLSSWNLVSISIPSQPGQTDHDLIQEQQKKLLTLSRRTLAVCVGRGMFTLSTTEPLLFEPIKVPPFNLNGKLAGTKTSVTLDPNSIPPETLTWPEFHNGVAAGLRITPDKGKVTNVWIVYNKPEELTNSYAGVLLALGLQGHLSALSFTIIYDYLSTGHELTSLALLLGLAVSKRGTMDASIAKLLSVHVPSLHPPSSTDLDVPTNVQISALLAIGFLYEGTCHRHITEILLEEIDRKPEGTHEFHNFRESYSLTAGLALGLVLLGNGTSGPGIVDLQIEDRLTRFIFGGEKTQFVAPNSNQQLKHHFQYMNEKANSSSYSNFTRTNSTFGNYQKSILVLEGNKTNIDITAPGSILALGLIFLKTNNKSVALRLNTPNTYSLLSNVRSDFILLRVLSRNLILWDSIEATEEWISDQIPQVIQNVLGKNPPNTTHSSDELEILLQAHANILAGCCLSLGIRYAGTADQIAHDLLFRYVEYFLSLQKNNEWQSYYGSYLLETCLDVSVLGLALIMAGTGNLSTFRLFRKLRKRHGSEIATYGSCMAIHMAIGFLFLGGGRFTISTSSNTNIAALVISLYPHFPMNCNNNRYHLQAFRNLYVLATNKRCIECRDVDTNQLCYVPLEITLKSNELQKKTETVLSVVAPTLVPVEFEAIKCIKIVSPRYWQYTIQMNSKQARSIFKDQVIYVKKKLSFLDYISDPYGHQSILSRSMPKFALKDLEITLTDDQEEEEEPPFFSSAQKSFREFVDAFSNDEKLVPFASYFSSERDKWSSHDIFFTQLLYDCFTQDKLQILPIYLTLYQKFLKRGNGNEKTLEQLNPQLIWNIKLLSSFYQSCFHSNFHKDQFKIVEPLISWTFIERILNQIENFFENFQIELEKYLKAKDNLFLGFSFQPPFSDQLFGSFLIYKEIPDSSVLFEKKKNASIQFQAFTNFFFLHKRE